MDGEFSRHKDALTIHRSRHNPEDPGYIEVTDSSTFKKFGDKHLATPGPKSGIKKRKFFDLKKENVQERIDQKPAFKTLKGIKSVFQYVCSEDGKVVWRKLPCFCVKCVSLEWDQCTAVEIAGKFKEVIKAGVDF